MKQNVGSTDRILRAVIGLVAVYLGYSLGGALAWVGYALGAIVLVTAGLGWCPLYLPFGISTRPKS